MIRICDVGTIVNVYLFTTSSIGQQCSKENNESKCSQIYFNLVDEISDKYNGKLPV